MWIHPTLVKIHEDDYVDSIEVEIDSFLEAQLYRKLIQFGEQTSLCDSFVWLKATDSLMAK